MILKYRKKGKKMKKVLFYLRKSWRSILIILLLLAIQAVCDLSLPDYTSRIINVGVQQNGIEYASPIVIRKDKLDIILLFTDDDTKRSILENYKIIKKEDYSKKEYQKLLDKYPLLEKEELYILKNDDKTTKENISNQISEAMLIESMLNGNTLESKQIANKIKENLPSEFEHMELIEIFKALPQEQMNQITKNIVDNFKDFPESIKTQSAISSLKTEYQIIGLNTDNMQTNYILSSGLKMLSLALLSMTATIGVGFLGSRTAARLGRDLREGVYEKTLTFGPTEFKEFGVASLITRSTNDIQQIQMLTVMTLRVICYAPIVGIGGVIKALRTNSSMAWIIAVAVMAIITLVITVFAIAIPKFKKVQKLIDRLNQVTREILSGIPVVRAFSNQKHEEKRFDIANNNLKKTTLFVDRIMAIMMPTMMFIMNAICILIIWKGANSINLGLMQVGDMLAYIQYTMQIVMAFLMISMFSIMFPRANVSIGRVKEVLEREPAVKNPENPKTFTKRIKGLVEFKNVSFRYPDSDEDILTDISFVANPKTTTAFIGSTGSGKSTLINLIPRLYDVTKGEILVDGVNVKDVTLHDLHDKIGFVPQKGILFSGTIESNIMYGNDSQNQEEMKKAASIAQASSFIAKKDKKYQSPIAQGGSNVSGGQKQRLSIARAIASNPEIYIFDDSFSALDFKTDAELRKDLRREISDATIFIVAQRISTIMHAEQIIVLDEGKVVGKGTHEELLKTCSIYQEIAESQLGKENLINE